MEGWIKIHRKMLDNPIVCKDCDYLSVWIYLLLNATHKEYDTLFKGKRITLQKGQLITGRKSIAKNLKISESKVQNILNFFKIEHQIEQQTSNQNRLITILNWEEYQKIEQQNEQQVNNDQTTDEQRVNTNKNVKNNKNIKKKKTFQDVFDEHQFSKKLENTLKDFIDMRKAIKKPMTTRALELLIRSLNKLTNLEAEQIAILNQSIEHSWQTVYPLKSEQSSTTNKTKAINFDQRNYSNTDFSKIYAKKQN